MDPNGYLGVALQLYVYNCTFLNNSVGFNSVVATTNNSDEQSTSPPSNNGGANGGGGGNQGGGQNPSSRGEMFDTLGGVIVGRQFPSRGGGLAVVVNAEDPIDVVVFGCDFADNSALAFGGGMYVGLDGQSQHSVLVNLTE